MRLSLASSERGEERQQRFICVESLPSTLKRIELFERLLFHRQSSLEIHVGGFNTFMTEPQGNRGHINPRLEQMHRGGVPKHRRSDVFRRQARARRDGSLHGVLSPIVHSLTTCTVLGHRGTVRSLRPFPVSWTKVLPPKQT
jgi:hypothetical protein